MTLQAASCWYRAWDSSCLVVSSCCLRLNCSSMRPSHSDWNWESKEGRLLELTGRGAAALLPAGEEKEEEEEEGDKERREDVKGERDWQTGPH